MKEFAVFWGCTIPGRFPFLEKSTRAVMEGLGLPLRDVDGFTCCPEKSLVNNVDHGVWTLTAARNVAVADELGLNLVSPCTGCISNLSTVKGELHADPGKKEEVNTFLKEVGREFKGKAKLTHLVPFFHDEVGIDRIKKKVKRNFTGMRVVVHYGCHMMRPSNALKNDDPLNPKKFDNLVEALGAQTLKPRTKLMCCGQGLDRVDQHETALHMARIKLSELKSIGTDALVLCCPSCFLQFDNNQNLMEKDGEKFGIPVLYFTELLGLSMGLGPEELGVKSHRVDVGPFLEKWESMVPRTSIKETIEEDLNVETFG
jgi:CoB--CoM heterodisulfide reductase subunit B